MRSLQWILERKKKSKSICVILHWLDIAFWMQWKPISWSIKFLRLAPAYFSSFMPRPRPMCVPCSITCWICQAPRILSSEKAMAPRSSALAWRIPWMEEPGRLQSMGSLRVWTRLSEFTFTFHFRALEKEIATHSSVLAWRIPGTGEPDGLSSMGLHRVGHDWSDLAAAAAARILSSPFLPCSLLFPLQLSFSPKSLPLNTSTETGPSSVPLRVYPHRREGLREAGKVVESLL